MYGVAGGICFLSRRKGLHSYLSFKSEPFAIWCYILSRSQWALSQATIKENLERWRTQPDQVSPATLKIDSKSNTINRIAISIS